MKLNDYEMIRVARWLRILSKNSYTAAAFVSTISPHSTNDHQWQLAVEIIYRLFASGLIESISDPSTDMNEVTEYCRTLAKSDPYSVDINIEIEWNIWDLMGTDDLREMIKIAHEGVEDDVAGRRLTTEVFECFEKAGVPWSSEIRFPISHTKSTRRG